MELSLVFVLVLSCVSAVTSYPRNFGVLPKDLYRRQVLQPIPGYIPVYIHADGELTVRKKLDTSRVYLPKTAAEVKGKRDKLEAPVPRTDELDLRKEGRRSSSSEKRQDNLGMELLNTKQNQENSFHSLKT